MGTSDAFSLNFRTPYQFLLFYLRAWTMLFSLSGASCGLSRDVLYTTFGNQAAEEQQFMSGMLKVCSGSPCKYLG